MYRVIKQSGKYYALEVDIADDDEQENIDIFVNEGTPVILVNDLEDLDALDIDVDEVQIIT